MRQPTIYKYPDELSEILFNGEDATGYLLLEAGIIEDGRGYILSKLDPTDPTMTEPKILIDGQAQNFTTWGYVNITE